MHQGNETDVQTTQHPLITIFLRWLKNSSIPLFLLWGCCFNCGFRHQLNTLFGRACLILKIVHSVLRACPAAPSHAFVCLSPLLSLHHTYKIISETWNTIIDFVFFLKRLFLRSIISVVKVENAFIMFLPFTSKHHKPYDTQMIKQSAVSRWITLTLTVVTLMCEKSEQTIIDHTHN